MYIGLGPFDMLAWIGVSLVGFAMVCRHGDRPYGSGGVGRSPVWARNGMASTSQPLASVAALRVLQDGGNAVDAAITASAVLCVVEPMMTGIGGDMLALVFMQKDGRPVGLNASGWAGSKATPEFLKERDIRELIGIHGVTVPGAVAGWFALHERYGRLPIVRLLTPAIEYAAEGFCVSEIIAAEWAASSAVLRGDQAAADSYLPNGTAPLHGEVFRNPDLARSLALLVDGGRDGFYNGELSRRIVETSERLGGFLTAADFKEFDVEWVEPLSTSYRGHVVCELPPNTQGITVLEMLNIMEGFDLRTQGHNSAQYLHTLVEAKRLAFADRALFVADPNAAEIPTQRLISKEYAARRRRQIDPGQAAEAMFPDPYAEGDTVYLSVVDSDRNVVSFINSLAQHFGSGLAPEGTAVTLHSRGAAFSLDRSHRNSLRPRKRPFHTLIPGMVLRGGQPYFSFGVMGGDMQPQGHVQILANLIDFGMNPQQAGEAARFRHVEGEGLALESAITEEVREGLVQRGHGLLDAAVSNDVFGGYQGILIDPSSGALVGGSDPRKDGLAIGW